MSRRIALFATAAAAALISSPASSGQSPGHARGAPPAYARALSFKPPLVQHAPARLAPVQGLDLRAARPTMKHGFTHSKRGIVGAPWPVTGGVGIINVGPEIQTSEVATVAAGHPLPDPAWRLCQIGAQPQDWLPYYCTRYSYHPYGAGGYRPLGTVKPYRPAPFEAVAPSARIITIDPIDK